MVLLHQQGEGGTILFEVGCFGEYGSPTFQFQVGEGGSVLAFEVADEQIGMMGIGNNDTVPAFGQLVFQGNKTLRHLLGLLGIDAAIIDEVAGVHHFIRLNLTTSVAVERIELGSEDGVVGSAITESDVGLRVSWRAKRAKDTIKG